MTNKRNSRADVSPVLSNDMEFGEAAQASRYDRKTMRNAMHVLEDSLASSSPTRESQWMTWVGRAASELTACMSAQRDEFHSESGMLSEITKDAPRLEPRVQRLRQTHIAALDVLRELSDLAHAEANPDDVNIAETRKKLGDVLMMIRNLHATESDLIYEAYNVDIGIGD